MFYIYCESLNLGPVVKTNKMQNHLLSSYKKWGEEEKEGGEGRVWGEGEKEDGRKRGEEEEEEEERGE